MGRLKESPEGRALWQLWFDRRLANNGIKTGHLLGYTWKQSEKLHAKARKEAQIITEYMMEKELIPKGEYAKEAIEAVVQIMRTPVHARDKLAAARTVLEWTLAKPAAESSVTIKSAEDYLSDIAKDAGIE